MCEINNRIRHDGDGLREYYDYEDVVLKIGELETYFTKTVEKREQLDNIKWTTYYVNPPCGLSVKIGSTKTSYATQNIDKITICEDYEGTMLYFHDKTDMCVEDIDIYTTEPLENIRFIFEYVDLKRSNTQNKEHQYYAELWEKLNPYNSIEENRKILNEYYNKIKEYEDEYYETPSIEIKLKDHASYTGEICKIYLIKNMFKSIPDNSKVTFDFSNVKYMSRHCAEEYLRQIRVKNIRSTEVNVNDKIKDLLDDVQIKEE